MSYSSVFVEVARSIFEQQNIFQKLNNDQRNNVLKYAYYFFYKLSFKSRDEANDISEVMQVQISLALGLMNLNLSKPVFFTKTKTVIVYPNRDLFIIDSTKSNNIILDNVFMQSLNNQDAVTSILYKLLSYYDLQLTITKDLSIPFGVVNYINHLINPNNDLSKAEQRQVWVRLTDDFLNNTNKNTSDEKITKVYRFLMEDRVVKSAIPKSYAHLNEKPLYFFKTLTPGFNATFIAVGLLVVAFVFSKFLSTNADTLLGGAFFFGLVIFVYSLFFTISSIVHYYSLTLYPNGLSWTTFLFMKNHFSFQDIQFVCMKDISHDDRPFLDVIVFHVADSHIKYQMLRADFSDTEKGKILYYFPKPHKSRLYTSFRTYNHYHPKVYKRFELSEIKKVLEAKFSYYNKLSSINRDKFLYRVKEFIDLTTFKGGKNLAVTDEQVILISACAQQLTFGLRAGHNYDYFDSILIYPSKYTSLMTGREHVGEMNTSGLIVFSWEDFLRGINIDDDSYNVGLHEFCHALEYMDIINEDMDYCYSDGLDLYMEMAEPYFNRRKTCTFFRDYAYTNRHEFLAVSTEYFFERSEDFEKELPILYKALCQMYNQNPAKLNQNNNQRVNY